VLGTGTLINSGFRHQGGAVLSVALSAARAPAQSLSSGSATASAEQAMQQPAASTLALIMHGIEYIALPSAPSLNKRPQILGDLRTVQTTPVSNSTEWLPGVLARGTADDFCSFAEGSYIV